MRLAIPAIVAGVAEPVISLTDVAVIGNIKGDATDALAAVGLVGTFLSAIIWTIAQTKSSISSIVSKAVGDKSLSKIIDLIPQVIWINILLGLIIYIITAPIADSVFSFYGPSMQVRGIATSYYQIRAIGFPLTLSSFAIFGIFRGLQNTSWAMYASLSGAIVNIVLDIILVFGIKDLIPSMGVEGAAYASLIAQVIMLLIALFFLFKKTPFGLKIRTWTLHPRLREHLALTLNFILRTASINVLMYLTYRFAGMNDTATVAAHAVLMNIWLFFSFLIDGFANAGNAIGGKLLGSRDTSSLRFLAIATTKYGVVVAIILSAVCALFYNSIGRSFTGDAAVLEVFYSVFWLVLLMQPINAIAFVFDGIFKGWGEARYLRNLLFMLTLFVFVPSIYLLDYLGHGIHAIWWAIFLWMLGRSICLVIKFVDRLSSLQN